MSHMSRHGHVKLRATHPVRPEQGTEPGEGPVSKGRSGRLALGFDKLSPNGYLLSPNGHGIGPNGHRLSPNGHRLSPNGHGIGLNGHGIGLNRHGIGQNGYRPGRSGRLQQGDIA